MKTLKMQSILILFLAALITSCGGDKSETNIVTNGNNFQNGGVDAPTGGSTFSDFADQVRLRRFKSAPYDSNLYIYSRCTGDIDWKFSYNGPYAEEDVRCYADDDDISIGTWSRESKIHIILGATTSDTVHSYIMDEIINKKLYSVRLTDTWYAIYTTDNVTYELDLSRPLEANPVFMIDNDTRSGFENINITTGDF